MVIGKLLKCKTSTHRGWQAQPLAKEPVALSAFDKFVEFLRDSNSNNLYSMLPLHKVWSYELQVTALHWERAAAHLHAVNTCKPASDAVAPRQQCQPQHRIREGQYNAKRLHREGAGGGQPSGT